MWVFIFSTNLSGIFLILRRIERDIIKIYIDLHVKYPLFLLDFNGTWVYRQIFEKYLNIKFHENRGSESGVVLYGQTEG